MSVRILASPVQRDISRSNRAAARSLGYALFCVHCKMACMPKLKGEQITKRFALAIVFACVLSGSALAGDVHTTGAPDPVPGDIHSTGAPASTTQTSSVAVTLIMTILSLVR